jgi:regulator of RNase E activity RraA
MKGGNPRNKRAMTVPLCDLLRRLREFDSALLANALDYIYPGPIAECYMSGRIQSVTPVVGPAVGVAHTIEIDSSTPQGDAGNREPYHRLLEQIEAADEPAVMIIKPVGSRPDHECVAGDGIAKALHAVGGIGIVADGPVRDVEAMQAVPMSVHARGRCVHHCAFRFKFTGRPVEIGGLTIHPNDVIHAGADGVLRLPKSHLEALCDAAPKVTTAEAMSHAVWRSTELSVAKKVERAGQIYKDLGLISAKHG